MSVAFTLRVNHYKSCVCSSYSCSLFLHTRSLWWEWLELKKPFYGLKRNAKTTPPVSVVVALWMRTQITNKLNRKLNFIVISWSLHCDVSADWLELPAAFFILVVVAPSFFASTIRDSWVGLVICLVIACYLLQEHIRAAGGFRDAFTKAHGVSNTIGIIVLFVYPVWALFLYIL